MLRVGSVLQRSTRPISTPLCHPVRSETRSSQISSTTNWITLSASQISKIRFRSSQEGSWGTTTHLGKPILTMMAAGNSVPAKIIPTNNAALAMFLTSSLVTTMTTLVPTMVLLWVARAQVLTRGLMYFHYLLTRQVLSLPSLRLFPLYPDDDYNTKQIFNLHNEAPDVRRRS